MRDKSKIKQFPTWISEHIYSVNHCASATAADTKFWFCFSQDRRKSFSTSHEGEAEGNPKHRVLFGNVLQN